MDPCDGGFVAFLFNEITRVLRDGIIRIVINLAARNNR